MIRFVISLPCWVLALVLAGCATAPSSRPTGIAALGAKVERVAQALHRYHEQNKQLPPTLTHLVPQYLAPQDLVLENRSAPLPFLQASLIYLPHDQIQDPDGGNAMLVFMSAELLGGGRFLIDREFHTWFVGEGRFQDWVGGRKFDENTQP